VVHEIGSLPGDIGLRRCVLPQEPKEDLEDVGVQIGRITGMPKAEGDPYMICPSRRWSQRASASIVGAFTHAKEKE
jgi:hypothetical protein